MDNSILPDTDNTPRIFYLKFQNAKGKFTVIQYQYSPGDYPQFDATFSEWKQRCIDYAKHYGDLKFVENATAEDMVNVRLALHLLDPKKNHE